MLIIWRVARAGLVAALLVGAAGWALERTRFGGSDADAVARIEAELRQRFDRSADTLGAIAARVAAQREAIRAAARAIPPRRAASLTPPTRRCPTRKRDARASPFIRPTPTARRSPGPAASRSSPKIGATARRRSLSRPARSVPASSASSRSSIPTGRRRPASPRLSSSRSLGLR